jgi:hypothetical protein
MKTALLTILALAAVAPGDYSAQSPTSVAGAWKLVAVSSADASGKDRQTPFGPNPTGRLVYTADGTMAVVISYSDRKPLSADRLAASTEERAEAFRTSLAYAGRYSLSGNQVTHHVEVSSIENWVNTDLVRQISFDGDRMMLRTPPTRGGRRITDLTWERVK